MAAIDDLKVKTDDQLQQQLSELKREQFNLRFQRAMGQTENVARVRQVRRDIARVKTIMRERAPSAPQGAPRGASQTETHAAPAGATQS